MRVLWIGVGVSSVWHERMVTMLRRPALQTRDNAAQAYARLWRDALVKRMALAEGVGLGLLLQLARLAPMLGIAVVVDKVATSHADATLIVIISGLALLACAESSLGAGRDEAQRELADRISDACRRRQSEVRDLPASTANVASLAAETLLAALTIPPTILALLITLWLASPAIAATALVGAMMQAAALRLEAATRREDRDALRRVSTELDAWRGQAQIASGLDDGCRRAARAGTESLIERQRQCQDRVDATRERLRRRTTMIHRITAAAVLGVGAQAIAANALTTGGLIVAVMVLRQLQGHVDGAAALLARANGSASSAAQLAAAPSRSIVVAPPGGVAVALREAIVRFGDDTQPALRLTLDIGAGSFVVVTGASGAGKSVLLRLIAGGIAPQSGAILRDERDGAAIALVAEDPWFPDGSIAEIVRPGPVHTEHADRLAALRDAEALELVRALPHGLAQRTGPGGRALPATLRPRLALARAFATRPRVLLIDGLPDRLDGVAAAGLLATLLAHREGMTIVAVTDRPDWHAAADRVVALHGGRIVARSVENPSNLPHARSA